MISQKTGWNMSGNKILFLRKSGCFGSASRKSAIVLSPELYWIKKIEHNVKSLSKAKKIAPSVFEGHLPHDRFGYAVTESNGSYYAIAYDPKEIESALEKCEIEDTAGVRICFMQQEMQDETRCVELDDFFCMTKIEGVWTVAPKPQGSKCISLKEALRIMRLPKFYITLKNDDSSVKIFKKVAIVFVFLLTVQFIYYYSYTNAAKSLSKKMELALERYSLPSTLMQLRSIEKRLNKKISRKEKQKRALKFFERLPMKGFKPLSFSIEKDVATLVLKGEGDWKSIEKSVSKAYKILDKRNNGKTFKIRWQI